MIYIGPETKEGADTCSQNRSKLLMRTRQFVRIPILLLVLVMQLYTTRLGWKLAQCRILHSLNSRYALSGFPVLSSSRFPPQRRSFICDRGGRENKGQTDDEDNATICRRIGLALLKEKVRTQGAMRCSLEMPMLVKNTSPYESLDFIRLCLSIRKKRVLTVHMLFVMMCSLQDVVVSCFPYVRGSFMCASRYRCKSVPSSFHLAVPRFVRCAPFTWSSTRQ